MSELHRTFIYHRSPHHAYKSGYAVLANHLDGYHIPAMPRRLPFRLRKTLQYFFPDSAGTYDSESIEKEWQLFLGLIHRNSPMMVHYLNGERDIRVNPILFKFRRNIKFMATFHKPPSILANTIKNSSYLKKLDGAIAVGNNQVEFLKNWLDISDVAYIPHGIDTTFFTPKVDKEGLNIRSKNILIVGQHLRDFDTINFVVPKIIEKIPDVNFQIVIRKEFVKRLEDPSLFQIYVGVPDTQLKELYQNAICLFLPLIDSTACNSILESLACGLPVISTDVGGVKSYLNPNCSLLAAPKKNQEMLDLLLHYLQNQHLFFEFSAEARKQSLKFDWEIIASQIEDFSKKILSN